MSLAVITPIVIIGMVTLGLTFSDANAELNTNNAFILEGSGFAVTEESIKTSEIDFAISTGTQQGSTIRMLIEDGFVTLNDNEFLIFDLEASGLREGRYIRISGIAEDSFGEEASIRLFGRLVENSAQGSIYGFTGRLTHDDIKYKVIYTTSLTGLTNISTTTEIETQEEAELVIHIQLGSSNQGIASSYIEAGEIRQAKIKATGSSGLRANYFSPDRVSIEPGTSVTFFNGDDVTHRIVSGTGLGSNSRIQGQLIICETPAEKLPEGFSHKSTGCAFTFDGRINSGTIEPGESWTGSFDDAGFYRIIDPDYPWMSIVVYSFPESDSEVIRRVGTNQAGN
jgi:plastocyanin